nr:MAG TPA: hypothetical protein [Caudoviricetes sp.]
MFGESSPFKTFLFSALKDLEYLALCFSKNLEFVRVSIKFWMFYRYFCLFHKLKSELNLLLSYKVQHSPKTS